MRKAAGTESDGREGSSRQNSFSGSSLRPHLSAICPVRIVHSPRNFGTVGSRNTVTDYAALASGGPAILHSTPDGSTTPATSPQLSERGAFVLTPYREAISGT